MEDIQSLSFKMDVPAHIVFASKYGRKEIYGKLKADIGKILKMLRE